MPEPARVLVTGGSGQLGSALVRRLLDEGVAPRCMVRDLARPGLLAGLEVELVQGDLLRPEGLAPAFRGVEEVFHLAGLVSYDPAEARRTWQVNVEGTRAALDAAAAAGARRLVLTSSIATLGYIEDPDGTGDEDSVFNWGPEAPAYMLSKAEAERVALAETRLDVVAVNPGITFGAFDQHRHAGRMIFDVAAGLPACPPGQTTCANLDDVVEGHLAALRRGQPGRRYVLGGHMLSFQALYARVAARMGLPPPTRVLRPWQLMALARIEPWLASLSGRAPRVTPPLARMSSANRRYRSDRAVRELGWSPQPLERGIDQCVSWYLAEGSLRLPKAGSS